MFLQEAYNILESNKLTLARLGIGAALGVGGYHAGKLKSNLEKDPDFINKKLMGPVDKDPILYKVAAKTYIASRNPEVQSGLAGAAIGAGTVGAGILAKKLYDKYKKKKKGQ